jgi:hypothetical protein
MHPHCIETTTFGVSFDTYANVKETLTKENMVVAELLNVNYDWVSVVSWLPFLLLQAWSSGLDMGSGRMGFEMRLRFVGACRRDEAVDA